MLLGSAGAHRSEMNDAECKGPIEKRLRICAGLLIALNAVGSSVQQIRRQFQSNPKHAWKQYLVELRRERGA